jgi:hypothetical protein
MHNLFGCFMNGAWHLGQTQMQHFELFDVPSRHDLPTSRRPLDSLDYLLSCGLLGSNILNAVPL